MDVQFGELGYSGPVRVLSAGQCRQFLAVAHDPRQPAPLDWFKGHAATSRAFYEVSTHPAILDVVSELLGGRVILWGASIVDRAPGQVHPWHCDIECSDPAARAVCVWIGLEQTSALSSLQVLPGSHRLGVTVQELRRRLGVGRGEAASELVQRWAGDLNGHTRVVSLEMTDGEAVFLDGRLWHASHNLSPVTRRALLLQYATPETAIRIPDPNVLDWPFRYFDSPRPPCLLLRGDADPGVNRIVVAPNDPGARTGPRLTSRGCPLDLPLDPDHATGWKPYPQFRGSTADLLDFSCHVSVLTPGSCPHPPHTHREEEILLVLSGEVEVHLPEETSEPRRRLRAGEFVYYPAEYRHTLECIGAGPADYLMFKWWNAPAEVHPVLSHRQYDAGGNGDAIQEGFQPRLLFEGPTNALRMLHAHTSTLTPGAGYEPHIDSYDVALVVLEGEIETLGQRVGPHGVVFYAAGEPHGIHNPGDVAARYLVFEFHGRTSLHETRPDPLHQPDQLFPGDVTLTPPAVNRLTGRLAGISNPDRWKRKLKQVLRRVLDDPSPT